jgi:hypothetical protein
MIVFESRVMSNISMSVYDKVLLDIIKKKYSSGGGGNLVSFHGCIPVRVYSILYKAFIELVATIVCEEN